MYLVFSQSANALIKEYCDIESLSSQYLDAEVSGYTFDYYTFSILNLLAMQNFVFVSLLSTVDKYAEVDKILIIDSNHIDRLYNLSQKNDNIVLVSLVDKYLRSKNIKQILHV